MLILLVVNLVEKLVTRLAKGEPGHRKSLLRNISRMDVIPGQRYAWRLFARFADGEPFATIVLDVNFSEAQEIDLQVRTIVALADL